MISGLEVPLLMITKACLCAAWDDVPTRKPARCSILPGNQVAADECCAGQAWVRWVRTFLSTVDTFPAAAGQQITRGQAGCAELFWAVDMSVGVMRCVPSAGEIEMAGSFSPPKAVDLEAATLSFMDDVHRVRAAMACCLDASIAANQTAHNWGETSLFLGQADPTGPQGGCVAFEMQVVVGVFSCPCLP